MVSAADKEQVEMLSKFWNDYGKGILIAVIIGLVIGFGWRYWQRHKVQHSTQAAVVFEQYYAASMSKNKRQAQALLTQLKKKYTDTPYASLASMFVAKDAVGDKDNKAALENLQWVVQHGQPATFKQIARIRGARVLLAMKQYKQAMQMLDVVNAKSFAPMIDSTRGQIYLAEGQSAKAKAAFKKAEDAYAENQIQNPILDMQVQSLK